MKRMLERIGLKVRFEVLTTPQFLRKYYHPYLDKPPEEQDWDMTVGLYADVYGHTGLSILTNALIEESDTRWIEYDPIYEEMWREMARTVDPVAQEEKIRQMAKYVYERAYWVFIYSPLSLYAVNKEVNFVPQKSTFLRLKETSVADKHWSIRGERSSLRRINR